MFFDTNVLVSAFISRGLCADLFRHVLAHHELVVGEVVIAELHKVLRDKLRASPASVAMLEGLLREQVVVPKPAKPFAHPVGDRADQWVLASAIAGKADVLVTGDADLLTIKDRSPVPIASPREFWNMLRA